MLNFLVQLVRHSTKEVKLGILTLNRDRLNVITELKKVIKLELHLSYNLIPLKQKKAVQTAIQVCTGIFSDLKASNQKEYDLAIQI